MRLGNSIRSIRLFKGYSQEYVANAIGISQNTYSRIERGEIDISEKRLVNLSVVFKLTVEDIHEFDERVFKPEFVLSEKSKAYFKAERSLINEMREQNNLFKNEIDKYSRLLQKLTERFS